MKDPVVKGHPLHAMLSDLPIGMTALGLLFDLLAAIMRLSQWSMAAGTAFGTAFLCGCAAALVGWWDYQAVPRDHPARRKGAVHGYFNAAALLLLLLSVLSRWLTFTILASGWGTLMVGSAFALGAFLLMTCAGWLGGELVFALGWRVTPAEHAQLLEENFHQQGQDEQVKKIHAIVDEYKQEHTLLP